jgi:hypothetical protein
MPTNQFYGQLTSTHAVCSSSSKDSLFPSQSIHFPASPHQLCQTLPIIHPNLPPHPSPNRSSWRFGYFSWDPQGLINSTPSQVMSLACPWCLNTIPSGSLILRNRLGLGSRPLNVWQFAPRIAENNFEWTSVSCANLLQNMPVHRGVQIGWSSLTMVLLPTY